MKRVLLLLFCLLAFPVVASHIVGGEFEIIYLFKNRYRINLILYFDELNGNPGAKDLGVTARIFRVRDNKVMLDVPLSLIKEEPVSYTQPECSNGEIVTSKITYSTEVTLPDSYDDPQGYYLSWERCCRNYTLNNIFSQDPNAGGQYAGQTFYLEFPPVVKDGQPFINSSPRLFPPLNDYACPHKPYYVDFAGTDDDGDSLVYSIVTPLNTKTGDALPLPNFLPRPKPYPLVSYRPPYGPGNIVGGAPDLRITQDGFLTLTPTNQGLFVFAVLCEEYRDDIKIGEVRRDFQMLVVDGCPQADPPNIKGKMSSEAGFVHDETMTVTFPSGVADANRCIQVEVSDLDASKIEDNFTEKVKIKAIPLNFKKSIANILPTVTNATLTHGSTAVFDICFAECPPLRGPFLIGIVAFDDACSLPLSDTLKITVNIEPPPNAKPRFTTPNITELVNEGDFKTWQIRGVDDDNDPMFTGFLTDGFSLQSVGMKYETVQQTNGLYEARLTWDSRCNVYDFTKKTNFEIKVLLEDQDNCILSNPDTMLIKLAIKLPGNADPIISTNLTQEEIENGLTKTIFDEIDFVVYGDDADADTLDLTGIGKVFAFNKYGIEFSEIPPKGHGIASHFKWNIECEKINLEEKSDFDFEFVVVDDNNKCRFIKTDTLRVNVKLHAPENHQPILSIVNTNPALRLTNNEQIAVVGDQITLALIAEDNDVLPKPDLISIEMIDASGNIVPSGYVYADAQGIGGAQTTFVWDTDCSVFQNGVYENNYIFKFRTWDDRCHNAKADTVELSLTIRDIDSKAKEFLPPNFFTSNGDEMNEFFAMMRENPLTHELESVLPLDNCVGVFVGVSIYNRWGKEVFQSGSRDFRWYPTVEPAGIYFYTLKYSDKEYKGSVTLRN